LRVERYAAQKTLISIAPLAFQYRKLLRVFHAFREHAQIDLTPRQRTAALSP
jgi:hypothetical protein